MLAAPAKQSIRHTSRDIGTARCGVGQPQRPKEPQQEIDAKFKSKASVVLCNRPALIKEEILLMKKFRVLVEEQVAWAQSVFVSLKFFYLRFSW